MLQTAVRAQISGQVCCASFREAAALQGYQSKYTFALICCHIYSKHSPPWKHSVSGEQSAPLIRGNLKGYGAAQESQNVFEWSRYDYDRNRPKIQPVCASSPRQRVCLKVPNFQIKKENFFFKKGKNATCASETTSRTELPRGLFLSAHFCRNIGFVKECEEVLIIDGGAVVLAVGLCGEG